MMRILSDKRAMMTQPRRTRTSQRPCKRACSALCCSGLGGLGIKADGWFIYILLRRCKGKEDTILLMFFIPASHSTRQPPPYRYAKRNELADFIDIKIL